MDKIVSICRTVSSGRCEPNLTKNRLLSHGDIQKNKRGTFSKHGVGVCVKNFHHPRSISNDFRAVWPRHKEHVCCGGVSGRAGERKFQAGQHVQVQLHDGPGQGHALPPLLVAQLARKPEEFQLSDRRSLVPQGPFKTWQSSSRRS